MRAVQDNVLSVKNMSIHTLNASKPDADDGLLLVQVVSSLVSPQYGTSLYDLTELDVPAMLETLAVGSTNVSASNATANSSDGDGGLRQMIVSKSMLVERLAARAEELFVNRPAGQVTGALYNETLAGAVQSNWVAVPANKSSPFAGSLIAEGLCAFHLPAFISEDRRRTDADIKFADLLCGECMYVCMYVCMYAWRFVQKACVNISGYIYNFIFCSCVHMNKPR
jgi:hypothetical protein